MDRSPRKCPACGELFIPNSPNHKYCGSKECDRIKNNEYKRNVRNRKKIPKMDNLTKDAIRARNLGMTYGQFKCKQWWAGKHVVPKSS